MLYFYCNRRLSLINLKTNKNHLRFMHVYEQNGKFELLQKNLVVTNLV